LLDDVEMVLDDEHGVAEIDEALENIEEFSNIVRNAGRWWLVEDVERAAVLALREFAGQLDALRFAAGKCGGGLASVT